MPYNPDRFVDNMIENALAETFGFPGCRDAMERCRTSRRFEVLRSLAKACHHPQANYNEAFRALVRAAKKLADNPSTRAMLSR